MASCTTHRKNDSRPHRPRHGWILPLAAVLSVFAGSWSGAPADELASPGAIAARLARAADEGRYDGKLVQEAGDAGLAAAFACVETLDDAHPQRRRMVHEVLAAAGRERGWNRELLRLYDPRGYELTQPDSGLAFQERVARCLTWETWEPATPDALVRTAPLPTLGWLDRQAKTEAPQAARVAAIARALGVWVRTGRELQYAPSLRAATATLLVSKALMHQPDAAKAIVRLAGEAGATEAVERLADLLKSDDRPALRAEVAAALGRIGGEPARVALIARLPLEDDPATQDKLAAALEHWPTDPGTGEALLALFKRSRDAGVRRSALFAAIEGRWPARPTLLHAGLDDEDGSVMGIALQALAAQPEPTLRDAVLTLAPAFKQPPATLVDALGAYADARASPLLAGWLERETNVPMMVKLVRALGSVGDAVARKALLRCLESQIQPLVAEHTVEALERSNAAEALPAILALARDESAPINVRLQAVQALGRFDTPASKACLNDLASRVAEAFAKPAAGESPGAKRDADRIDEARVFLALSRLRLNEPGAGAEFQRLFDQGTATSRFYALRFLAITRTHHPAIRDGLKSNDFATLLAAVLATKATRPAELRAELLHLKARPLLQAMGESGVDTVSFLRLLDEAIAAAEAKAP